MKKVCTVSLDSVWLFLIAGEHSPLNQTHDY